uniref:Uncharacterized protein n=1 Tax=Arundo donax TaxID=35708 RepID=A0A0A9A379_ARUDO
MRKRPFSSKYIIPRFTRTSIISLPICSASSKLVASWSGPSIIQYQINSLTGIS